eukprot:8743060-Lingulodinium_polyedra.AAC.1
MERATVRRVSRCCGKTSIRSRHCATFSHTRTTNRSNRHSVAATAHAPLARALHAQTKTDPWNART